jgi:hypothetical protein
MHIGADAERAAISLVSAIKTGMSFVPILSVRHSGRI